MNGSRVLVAGCGDLGSRVAATLADRGLRVAGIRRTWSDPIPGVQPIEADLTRPGSLSGLPPADTVVYCAAATQHDEAGYRAIYVEGLANLLARLDPPPGGRLVFVSSTAVYGQDDGSVVDETSATEPDRFNGVLMLEGERLALGSLWRACALRLGGIYGPGRTWLLRRALDPGASCQDPPPRWTNRIHIEDAAGLVLHLLDRAELPEVVNGVDPNPATECEVMDWLCRRQGRPAPARRAGGGAARRVVCRSLEAGEYHFRYPDFRAGYESLLG